MVQNQDVQHADLILSDKFAPTSLPDVYAPRLQVVNAIGRAVRKRFVFISAPAGSGKTVSALLWIRKSKLPTVKSHIQIAYRKLNVNSAMDAVLKARELKLIE